ncbi:hypothetical protein E2C01_014966 [Portunus trituberculatus]|uniref:Uncharacterized protein n=1 Tax=Portunus trituberculatus TaxID=210409 RepID=A0A5B7DK37_PORTR|nr:hypothetical protein [Portunus trituberculatus]
MHCDEHDPRPMNLTTSECYSFELMRRPIKDPLWSLLPQVSSSHCGQFKQEDTSATAGTSQPEIRLTLENNSLKYAKINPESALPWLNNRNIE